MLHTMSYNHVGGCWSWGWKRNLWISYEVSQTPRTHFIVHENANNIPKRSDVLNGKELCNWSPVVDGIFWWWSSHHHSDPVEYENFAHPPECIDSCLYPSSARRSAQGHWCQNHKVICAVWSSSCSLWIVQWWWDDHHQIKIPSTTELQLHILCHSRHWNVWECYSHFHVLWSVSSEFGTPRCQSRDSSSTPRINHTQHGDGSLCEACTQHHQLGNTSLQRWRV